MMFQLLTLRETNTITRSNMFKLTKDRVASKKYQWFFTNRVINMWNKLPNSIVSSDSLTVSGSKFGMEVDSAK